MISKFIQRFNVSAGLLLVGMAMLHLLGNQGENILQPADPILQISTRSLFWLLAVFEIGVAGICLFARSPSLQNISVFWLTSNLLLYRLGLLYFGVRTVRAYYDTMAFNFGISAGTMNLLLAVVMAYLWFGSGVSLFLLRRESRQRERTKGQIETIVQA